MSGYIKSLENGGKNMSFLIKDDDVSDEYNEIWNRIWKTLGIKFHSMLVYDEKYIKAKAGEFSENFKSIDANLKNLCWDQLHKVDNYTHEKWKFWCQKMISNFLFVMQWFHKN